MIYFQAVHGKAAWRDGRVDEGNGLENRSGHCSPGVRIPLPPSLINKEKQYWGDARVDDWGRLLSG